MNKRFSNCIYITNFIMIILIVFLHSLIDTEISFLQDLSSIIRAICDMAVPTFFVLSSFLLFKKGQKSYFTKIKSRIKTLVIPYLLWSGIFYAIYLILSQILSNNSLNNNYVTFSFTGMLKSILYCKQVPQLWYMRVLFEMVLISYIYNLILKKSKAISFVLIPITLSINFIYSMPTSNFITWLPLFWMVAWLTYNYEDKLYSQFDKKNVIVSIISFIVIIICSMLVSHTDLYSNFYYIWRLVSPALFILFITNLNVDFVIKWYHKQSFYIFVLHYFIILIVRTLLFKVLSESAINVIIVYLLSVSCGIAIPLLVSRILNKVSRKMYLFLSGERGL